MAQEKTPGSNSPQRARRLAAGIGVIGVVMILCSCLLPLETYTYIYEICTPYPIGLCPFQPEPFTVVTSGIERMGSGEQLTLVLLWTFVALFLLFVLIERKGGISWTYIGSGLLFLTLYIWVLSSGAYLGEYGVKGLVADDVVLVSVTHEIGWYVWIGSSILLGLSLLGVGIEEIVFRIKDTALRRISNREFHAAPKLVQDLLRMAQGKTMWDGVDNELSRYKQMLELYQDEQRKYYRDEHGHEHFRGERKLFQYDPETGVTRDEQGRELSLRFEPKIESQLHAIEELGKTGNEFALRTLIKWYTPKIKREEGEDQQGDDHPTYSSREVHVYINMPEPLGKRLSFSISTFPKGFHFTIPEELSKEELDMKRTAYYSTRPHQTIRRAIASLQASLSKQ